MNLTKYVLPTFDEKGILKWPVEANFVSISPKKKQFYIAKEKFPWIATDYESNVFAPPEYLI